MIFGMDKCQYNGMVNETGSATLLPLKTGTTH